jgi:ATP-dependent RNA helicase RhlE
LFIGVSFRGGVNGTPTTNRREARLISTEEADSKASPDLDAVADPGAPFAALGLSPLLVEALVNVGYNQPTEIQRLGIPLALAGTDVLGTAHTGTGKTAAFTLPMIQRLADGAQHGFPRGLVITPTRELAQQIGEAVRRYGATSSLEVVVVHGGTRMGPEIAELKFGCDVLIATPGRLLDYVRKGIVKLAYIEVLVIDEADRMLDMGFIDDVKEIVANTPRERQTLLFSATMPNGITGLATDLMRDPERVNVGLESAADGIRQVVYPVDWPKKHELLLHILGKWTTGQVLVFTRTRDTAGYLTGYLEKRGLPVAGMHGAMPQRERDRNLKAFRESEKRILVATNVAARGLDIRGIEHVINFDAPEDPRDYVHRVGRTARGDATGEAYTLVAPNDWQALRQIETLTGEAIPREFVEGFEPSSAPPDAHIAPAIIEEDETPGPERSALTRGRRGRPRRR